MYPKVAGSCLASRGTSFPVLADFFISSTDLCKAVAASVTTDNSPNPPVPADAISDPTAVETDSIPDPDLGRLCKHLYDCMIIDLD